MGIYRTYTYYDDADYRLLLTGDLYELSFFGMGPLVFVLLGSVSGLLFWERLGGLMLYSMEASSWCSPDPSACRRRVVSEHQVKVDQWCYLCVLCLCEIFNMKFTIYIRHSN